MKIIRTIELEFCCISLREDGIIENRFNYDTPYEIDAIHMKEIAAAIHDLSDGSPKPLMSIAGLYGSITPEARKVNINPSGEYTMALALVIRELPQRLLANFYFKVKSVEYPVKTFRSEEEASAWLIQHIRSRQLAG